MNHLLQNNVSAFFPTALTMQYVSKVFLDFHDPTIEDVFQTQTVVDGEAGIVDILDTAGQVRKSNLLNLFSPR